MRVNGPCDNSDEQTGGALEKVGGRAIAGVVEHSHMHHVVRFWSKFLVSETDTNKMDGNSPHAQPALRKFDSSVESPLPSF